VSNGPVTHEDSSAGAVHVFDEDQLTVVMLAGEVDGALAHELDAAHRQIVERDEPVQLDVYRLRFLDSIAVGFVARLAVDELERGRRVTIVGASRATRETLMLHGVAHLFDGLRLS
jgi:anti-anti-sigma factor